MSNAITNHELPDSPLKSVASIYLRVGQFVVRLLLVLMLFVVSLHSISGIRALVFSSAKPQPVVEFPAKVLLSSNGSWRFTDSPWPMSLSDENHAHSTPHLLPIDDQSKRICGRWSDENELLMELISLNNSADALLSQWRQAGWEIRHTPWGNPSFFSFLCVKDGTVIYAWSRQSEQIQTLLLSSSPDVSVSPATRNRGKTS